MSLLEKVPSAPVAAALTGDEPIGIIKDGVVEQTTTQDIANLAPAAVNAQFIVAAASSDLGAERVATDTATVAWNFGTAAQAKASVVAASIGTTQLASDAATPGKQGLAARNETGGTLTVGTLVTVSGGTATLPLLVKADANGAGLIAAYVVDTAITDTTNGTVGRTYLLTGIDTSSASAVGSPVYLSETAGGYTFTAPTAAASRVQIVGQVTIKHASTGAIQFNLESQVTTKFGTDELQDGSVTSAKLAAGAGGNPIIAGCTVASDGTTVTNAKNITSSAHTGTGVYTVTVTTNTATKYAPQVSLNIEAPSDAYTIMWVKTSATVWVIYVTAGGSADDRAFSFFLMSLD